MKTNRLNKMILGLAVVIMLVVGVGSIPANAQNKQRVVRRPARVIVYRNYNPFWYRYYDPFYNPFWDPFYSRTYQVVDPIAYQKERGYSEGKDEGEEDAEKGRTANATGHKDYLKSDSVHFREAFVQGYEAGYREEAAEIKEKTRKQAEKLRNKLGD